MSRLERNQRVTKEQVRERVLGGLACTASPLLASHLANIIWPGHRMKKQGAGYSAAMAVRPLLKEGLITYVFWENGERGYILVRGYQP